MAYTKAILNVELFAVEDVITTSNPTVEIPYGGDPLKDLGILPPKPQPTGTAGSADAVN